MALMKISIKNPFGKFVVSLKYMNKISMKKPFGNIHWVLELTNECYQMAFSLNLEKLPNANSMKLPIHISIGYFYTEKENNEITK